jgi:septal ring-binding cell division protein DamX
VAVLMAELRNDILKEEEQIGGFTPGEPDDDSFMLQDKSYTGNIFLFLNPLVTEPEEIEDVPDEEIFEEEEHSSLPEEVAAVEKKSDYKMMDIGGDESEDDLFEFEKKKLHKNTDESEEIDDPNLVGYIKGLLSVSKRKSKNQQQNEINKEEVEIKPFIPIVGNSADTQLVISDMDLDKPSTSTLSDRQISEEDNPIPEATFDMPEPTEPEKPKDEKKKKKLPLIFWLGAAALLILVLGAGAYFWLFNSVDHNKDTHTKISVKDSIKLAEKVKKGKAGDKSDSLKSKSEQIPDSLKLAEKNYQDSLNNAQTKLDEKIADKSTEIEVINQTEKPVEVKSNNLHNKEVSKQETKSIPVPIEKTGAKPANPVDIKQSNTDLAEKLRQIDKKAIEGDNNITKSEIRKVPEKLKKVDLATAKPVKPLDIKQKALSETYVPKEEQKESIKEAPRDVPGIYIVQIYSSPSKEDAQLWLNKLKARNVHDGFISEQTMRDKIWYRVRFGHFRTREEARIAALRFGFAQTWIDRVK